MKVGVSVYLNEVLLSPAFLFDKILARLLELPQYQSPFLFFWTDPSNLQLCLPLLFAFFGYLVSLFDHDIPFAFNIPRCMFCFAWKMGWRSIRLFIVSFAQFIFSLC